MPAVTFTHARAHTHTHMHTHMHRHTQTHIHTPTHTHTHIHTRIPMAAVIFPQGKSILVLTTPAKYYPIIKPADIKVRHLFVCIYKGKAY